MSLALFGRSGWKRESNGPWVCPHLPLRSTGRYLKLFRKIHFSLQRQKKCWTNPLERILKAKLVGVSDPDSIWVFTGHYFKWFWNVISLDATILLDNYCHFIPAFRWSSLTNGSLITTKYPVHYPVWNPRFFFFFSPN